ncbi:Ger(x)C family spore germination protein [Bacillus sp. ISL-40]|uniref:Ger(x)C family spore germination protein n=1 Tax=unclassified Bacillus (in: firmicutes) TaxID=185979 RepID=UPI001BEA6962|nr:MULTISPECIES: Ger(x)C family spore germination protein [unclassified Bacillus (in: firmicutes)]MBT2698820.1 Ger(x)C family spore germination protein [Bacillus sp. ISL-40]MBT2720735.1 Ger(x)C family spore germination protein [Bacillus sp. ISL-46]MBT2740990.1 Ger(x)C family spore germination protein [Bacillus sp. ISL-77]
MSRFKLCITLLGVFSVFLTGCWDHVEIEDRGFIIGLAIDLAEETDEKLDESEGEYRYKGTYQFVVPSGLSQGDSGQGGQGGTSQKAYNNLVIEDETISGQSRHLAEETSRTPFNEHLQTIIVSENVAKIPKALGNVLDFFLRDSETRRGIKVMIAEGEAGPILGIQPTPENLPVMHIDSIAENSFKNARILPEKRIGSIHERLIDKTSFVVPKIKMDNQKINIAGAAVFHGHNNQMIGFINGDITEGLNLITGDYKGGILKTKVENKLVVYEIKREKSSVKVESKNKENIQFHIKIEAEGQIGESFGSLDYMNPKILSKVETAVEKEIERKVSKTIKTFQEDLRVDALGLGGYLQREDYNTWKRIKQDWDDGKNYFSTSTIKVQADIIVQTPGAIIESEKQ